MVHCTMFLELLLEATTRAAPLLVCRHPASRQLMLESIHVSWSQWTSPKTLGSFPGCKHNASTAQRQRGTVDDLQRKDLDEGHQAPNMLERPKSKHPPCHIHPPGYVGHLDEGHIHPPRLSSKQNAWRPRDGLLAGWHTLRKAEALGV